VTAVLGTSHWLQPGFGNLHIGRGRLLRRTHGLTTLKLGHRIEASNACIQHVVRQSESKRMTGPSALQSLAQILVTVE
jgi:hypothetical protein